jgi:cellobiose phosphorylase
MIAGLFCAACDAMAGIYNSLGNAGKAGEVASAADAMRKTIETAGWDGQWFLRAYDAAQNKIGSHECAEGKIFIESQGWCVMGGVGITDGNARKALDSVAKYLATPNGIVLQQPAYATYHKQLGEISSYPPGYKENAGIFTHNNTWIQVAETLLGDGDAAFRYYMAICPSAKESQIETYRAEPYVYSQMTAGPDAATPGEAKNTWLTGTAAWSFVAISQYILGVRPGVDGLVVDPCIPRSWTGYTVRRAFRGKVYNIEVRNPAGLCRGVASLTIDGKPVTGNVIPANLGGKEVTVTATLG